MAMACKQVGIYEFIYEPFMLLKQLQASVALSNVGLVPATHNKSVWNF